LPDVLDVAGEAARNDEDRVDAHIVIGLLVARRETLRCNDDAREPQGIERHCCSAFGRSRLHFDEGEDFASLRYDVDLAAGNASAPGEDAPVVEAESPAGDCLGSAAALFGCFAVHFERSRARA
jgi:hypothetical protein